jgi:hypothetical protein
MSTKPNLIPYFIGRLIRFYQVTVSPDHGLTRPLFPRGVCRFTPTCSEYAIQAINKYGWSGLLLALRRVVRCHPFTAGGPDPVPQLKP